MGFNTCGPNEAMVISGMFYSEPRLVHGGGVWVWPCVQLVQRISLNTFTLQINSKDVCTSEGVQISCTGTAQVKIHGANEEMLRIACLEFLSMTESEIQSIALETMEGHQRAIMGRMTVEEIYRDRNKLRDEVLETAKADFLDMGINVVSYTIKDISDSGGYLEALGAVKQAQVERDVVIGEAIAKQNAEIREAKYNQERCKVEYERDTDTAKDKRDCDLNKAANTKEMATKRAASEKAYQRQAVISKQANKLEEMRIIIGERAKQIEVQDLEIKRCENKLKAEIKKPADAEKYRLETIAAAEHNRVVLEAEAIAEAIQIRGAAQAFAIEAKATADAEQMAKKAEAWKGYQEAARVDMILKALPMIASEVAAPLSRLKKVTMISSGDGDIGAAKLTAEVIAVIGRLPKMIEDLTGIDISSTMHIKEALE